MSQLDPPQSSLQGTIQADGPRCDDRLSSYSYELPEKAIAQMAVEPRHSARLMALDAAGGWRDRIVADLPGLLRPGDLLVLNDTRVLKARLRIRRSDGGAGELLLLEPRSEDTWLSLVKPGRRIRVGDQLQLTTPGGPIGIAVVDADQASGGRLLRFPLRGVDAMEQLLNSCGHMPLPPYIRDSSQADARYQTTYAEKPGAVAAPTAGLHLSHELRHWLAAAGVRSATLTLHVGLGTFRPLDTEDLSRLELHSERVEVSRQLVDAVRTTRAAGGRVIAVGTTSCRALEGAAQAHGGQLDAFSGRVKLCIRPGYRFRVVQGLLTNFHLPCSSLLLLVSALIGRERLLEHYADALASGYRFYSYGDAMWIDPEAVLPEARP